MLICLQVRSAVENLHAVACVICSDSGYVYMTMLPWNMGIHLHSEDAPFTQIRNSLKNMHVIRIIKNY